MTRYRELEELLGEEDSAPPPYTARRARARPPAIVPSYQPLAAMPAPPQVPIRKGGLLGRGSNRLDAQHQEALETSFYIGSETLYDDQVIAALALRQGPTLALTISQMEALAQIYAPDSLTARALADYVSEAAAQLVEGALTSLRQTDDQLKASRLRRWER